MQKYVLILAMMLSFNAYADELPSCGTNCTYSLVQNGMDKNNNPTYTLIMEPIDKNKEASTIGSVTCSTSPCRNTSLWANSNVTKVEFKEGITTIGKNTLEFMHSVTSISLPKGLKTIATEAMNGTSVSHLDIPSSVTSIGSYGLAMGYLKSINGLPQGLTSIHAWTFESSQLKDLVIPDSVTTISENAFGKEGHDKAAIQTLYCSEALQSQCEAAVQWKKDLGREVNVVSYQKYGNSYYYKGKFYTNPNDIIGDHHIKKRIYSIDEANKVAKRTGNTFRIRYR